MSRGNRDKSQKNNRETLLSQWSRSVARQRSASLNTLPYSGSLEPLVAQNEEPELKYQNHLHYFQNEEGLDLLDPELQEELQNLVAIQLGGEEALFSLKKLTFSELCKSQNKQVLNSQIALRGREFNL